MDNLFCIKELAKMQGLSLTDLAERIGIDRSSMSLIANGRQWPTRETIGKIAEVLNVEVKDLFVSRSTQLYCPKCGNPLVCKSCGHLVKLEE